MPIYTHQTKNSHFLKNRRFFCLMWMGFYDRPGWCKKFALRYDLERVQREISPLQDLAFVRTYACLAKVSNCTYNAKKCLWGFFDTGFVSNFPNKHSWQILKISESAITHFSFLVKNREINCGLRRIFYGSLSSDVFVIFALKYFFSYYVLKKYVTEDGRRKLKNWH